MALKIMKKMAATAAASPVSKPKAKAKTEVVISDFADKIDAVVELAPEAAKIAAKIKALNEQLKPYKDAVSELEAAVKADETLGDDEEGKFYGNLGYIEVGKKGKSRSIIDMAAVREAMTEETFMQVAKVNLTDMDKYLTGVQVEELVETSRTTRTVKGPFPRTDA